MISMLYSCVYTLPIVLQLFRGCVFKDMCIFWKSKTFIYCNKSDANASFGWFPEFSVPIFYAQILNLNTHIYIYIYGRRWIRRWLLCSRCICDMTHSYVWHDPSLCVTWLIQMCGMAHSQVSRDTSYNDRTLSYRIDHTLYHAKLIVHISSGSFTRITCHILKR